MFYIGNVKIENNLILAPMAGVSNAAFRVLSRKNGAGLSYAEMVSDKGLVYENEKTFNLLKSHPEEHPYAQQIFGSEITSMVKAAKLVNDYSNCDIIDLNMGCPVPKVASRAQAGAGLLKNPNKIYEIVKEIKKVISKPLTVKIRSGWDFDSINAVEVALKIEEAGADAIIIHGRTRSQMYNGKADLDIIKAVKDAVKIPVIGNGDIIDGPSADYMFKYTGVDAVMIGRAALGNPWIFNEINTYLNTGKTVKRPELLEIKKTMIKHYDLLVDLKGEHLATLEMRGQAASYLKGLKGASLTRNKLSKMNSKVEFHQIIDAFFQDIE